MKTALALSVALFALAASAQTNEVLHVKVEEAVAVTIDVAGVVPVEQAQMSQIEAEPVLPVPPASDRSAWHDSIEAEKGSRAYWILYMAREKAKRGEDTGPLARAFAQTLAKWMSQ